MDWRKYFGMARQAASDWIDDRAPSMGAALSYYTVFSVAPLLLIVIVVAGLVFGREAAQGAIVAQIGDMVGRDSAHAIQGLLQSVSEPRKGLIATITGVVLLLVGATTVFAELQDDLNRIWKAPPQAMPTGIWGWVRARLLSIGMIMAIGFLLLVSLAVSAAIAALGEWSSGMFGSLETLAQAINVALSFGIVTTLFALIYRFMPQVHIEWHDVWIGAAVTALLFTIGKYLIGLYIGKSAVASGFGAAGSLAVILVWVYYSAQIFLLGAEFTHVYAHAVGSRKQQPDATSGAKADVKQETRSSAPSTVSIPAAVTGTRPAVASVSSSNPLLKLVGSLAAGSVAGLAFEALRRGRPRLARSRR
ncbi:MAG TPA: YihY/virulence factor BrkB family protein [Burkholderiaceae bacterium]|nr:YihY/virulence factor BrkB family protein [Burkholderiaceae bacterium]